MGQDLFGYDEGNEDFFNYIFDDVQIDIFGNDDDDIIFKDVLENSNDNEIFPERKLTFDDFVKTLYGFIDPHQALLITTNMLLMVDKAFAEEFGNKWNKLRRDDKRKKERILQKFYENADIILQNIQNEPDKYLCYVRQYILKKYSLYKFK